MKWSFLLFLILVTSAIHCSAADKIKDAYDNCLELVKAGKEKNDCMDRCAMEKLGWYNGKIIAKQFCDGHTDDGKKQKCYAGIEDLNKQEACKACKTLIDMIIEQNKKSKEGQ